MARYLDSISLFPSRAIARLLNPTSTHDGNSAFGNALRSSQDLDPLSRLQSLDLQTYLPGDILTKVDRMTMKNSLEARVPLLDHPLVEYACGVPARLRLRAGQTKHLLKRVLRSRVPDEVLTRPKQGFGVPLLSWFSTKLPKFFRDQLGDANRLESVGIKRPSVFTLIEQFEARHRQDHCHQLWALVVLDRCLRRLSEGAVP